MYEEMSLSHMETEEDLHFSITKPYIYYQFDKQHHTSFASLFNNNLFQNVQ